MSFLVNLSMFPVGREEGVSKYVARVIKTIEEHGLNYVLTPMSTVIEGKTWDDVIPVIREAFYKVIEDNNRVYMVLTLDFKKNRENAIVQKVRSVKQKLQTKSLEEARSKIDNIDQKIVELLAERQHYVKEALRHKKDLGKDIEQKDRQKEVIEKIKGIAKEYGLDENVAASIYEAVIKSFIDLESSNL